MGFWKLGFLETFLLLTGAVSIATAQPSPLQPGLQSQSGEPTNIPQIPAPSGPFGVGRVSYEWIDVARPDGHSSDPEAHRDLMLGPQVSRPLSAFTFFLQGVDRFGSRVFEADRIRACDSLFVRYNAPMAVTRRQKEVLDFL